MCSFLTSLYQYANHMEGLKTIEDLDNCMENIILCLVFRHVLIWGMILRLKVHICTLTVTDP